MQKNFPKMMLPLVILLFVGSSGCTSSDIQDVMEIFGGTNGPKAGDVASQAVGGDKTGDKDKDKLLDAGGDTIENIRKAKDLEDEANAALSEVPPKYAEAKAKLDAALKLRPNDWGLQNRVTVMQAAQGQLPKAAHEATVANCEGRAYATEEAKKRCINAAWKDREKLLEASVAQQKASGATVSCMTYGMLLGDHGRVGEYTKLEPGISLSPDYPTPMVTKTYYLPGYEEKMEHLRSLLHAGACSGNNPWKQSR